MSETVSMASRENVVRGSFRKPFLVRLAGRVKTWNQRRRAIRELHEMSDALLRDLGIERYQIEEVVRRGGQFASFDRLPRKSAVAPLKKAAA